MFFVVVGTHTEHVINEFALDARINILICQCHTVTNGTDLRRSPQMIDRGPQPILLGKVSKKITVFF